MDQFAENNVDAWLNENPSFLRFLEDEEPKADDPKPDTEEKKEKERGFNWNKLVSGFTDATNGWKQFTSAFKTTRSSTIKERIVGKGFDSFRNSAQINISKRIPPASWNRYLASLSKRMKVPADRANDLALVLEDSEYIPENIWSAINTLFSIGSGGTVNYASLYIYQDTRLNEYTVVYSDVQAEFTLAPDVMIINKKLSVAGGIWEDEKEIKQEVPRSLDPEDIRTVLNFFQMVAFKSFCDQFGIKVETPSLK